MTISSDTVIKAQLFDGQGNSVGAMAEAAFAIDSSVGNMPRSGLAAWYRADAGVIEDQNSKIIKLEDQSGQGNDGLEVASDKAIIITHGIPCGFHYGSTVEMGGKRPLLSDFVITWLDLHRHFI